MRSMPIIALTSIALVIGAANLHGQAADSVPPIARVECCPPAAGPVCPPKPCQLCPTKPACEDKGSKADKCVSHPSKITVIVPPPQVVIRRSGTSHAAPPPSPAAAPHAAPPAAAQQSYLVPQMSYTMQPVVTMQAVPTVSYGVVMGPAQQAGAIPYGVPAAAPYAAQPYAAAPPALPFLNPFGCSPVSDVETLLKILKALKAAGSVLLDSPPPANATVKDYDNAIKALQAKLEEDIVKLSRDNVQNIKDITALQKAQKDIVDALTSSPNFDAAKERLQKLPK